MAESVEHQFLSQCVLDVLDQFAATRLYAYVEAERRKFDFACELVRDWSRPLVGQTLWNHTAGVDKDLRTMLLDRDAEICAYVARDTMKARRLLSEAIRDFRSSGAEVVAPHRLRVFWVPYDFDADNEGQRGLVRTALMESVNRDILLNVVFGNLNSEGVRFFVRTSGVAGLHLAMLHFISTTNGPELRARDLAQHFGVSQGAIRERLLRLLGCGFVDQFGGGATLVSATTAGRVFLDMCGQLWRQSLLESFNPELLQIMRLLDMRYAPSATSSSAASLHLSGPMLTEVPEMVTGRLIATVDAAIRTWGIGFDDIAHVLSRREGSPEIAGTYAKVVINNLREESGRFHRP